MQELDLTRNLRIFFIAMIFAYGIFITIDLVSEGITKNKINITNGYILEKGIISKRYLIFYYLDRQPIEYEINKKYIPCFMFLSNITKNISNSTIFNWYRTGHYINAFTKLKALLYSPSYDLIAFTDKKQWDSSRYGKFTPRSKIKEISYLLLSNNTKDLLEFLDRRKIQFIVITKEDLSDIDAMLFSLYQGKFNKVKLSKNANIFLLYNNTFPKLKLIYDNNDCKIYYYALK